MVIYPIVIVRETSRVNRPDSALKTILSTRLISLATCEAGHESRKDADYVLSFERPFLALRPPREKANKAVHILFLHALSPSVGT